MLSERVCVQGADRSRRLHDPAAPVRDGEHHRERAHGACISAVTMLDNGESTRLESALLKGYACRELTRVADLAMSIYAAIGYTKEMRIGRIWADLRGNEMGGGTTEVMEYIAGRQLAKKYKAK